MIYNKQIFTSCDGVYFDKYAEILIASININSPGFKVVFHIYNPSDDFKDKATSIKASAKSTEIEFITEEVNLDKLDKTQRATFFACDRFVKLAKCVSETKLSTLFLDVDSIVKKDLTHIDIEYPDCDLAIHMRPNKKLDHMKLLAGVMWLRYSDSTLNFLNGVSEKLSQKGLEWFADQTALYNCLKELKDKIKISHLERRFIDWEFGDDSVIWVGKGDRKDEEAAYLDYGSHLLEEFQSEKSIAIICPRVDLGFKETSSLKSKVIASRLKDEVRIYWMYFAKLLKDACKSEGHNTEVITVPQWLVHDDFIASLPHDKIYVPHKNHHQIKDSRATFYMQEVYPFLFTVDSQGWGGSSSKCGSDEYLNVVDTQEAKEFVDDIKSKKITKYKQVASDTDFDFEFDVFFPLQIPNDETLKYHSDVSLKDVVESVIKWADANGRKVLFKCHPMNKDVSFIDSEFLASDNVKFVADGDIHDFIDKAKAVFVVNSGVGFEAVLYNKPIVTFGRSIYDMVTFKSTLSTIEVNYKNAVSYDFSQLSNRYLKFLQWYFFEESNIINKPNFSINIDGLMKKDWVNSYHADISHLINIKDAPAKFFCFPGMKKNPSLSFLKAKLNKLKLSIERRKISKEIESFDINSLAGKRVALVGNGSSILDFEYGREIDEHDIVIRMNLGHPYTSKKNKSGQPTIALSSIVGKFKDRRVKPLETHYIVNKNIPRRKQEKHTNILHVGTKTSIWSFSTVDQERQEKYYKFFKGATPIWIHPAVENISPKVIGGTQLVGSEFYKKLKKKFNIEPSSGVVLVELLKSSQAKEVNLYGFDFFASGHIARKNPTKKFFHSSTGEKEIVSEAVRSDARFSIRSAFKRDWVCDYVNGKDVCLINFGPTKKKIFKDVFTSAKSVSTIKKDSVLNNKLAKTLSGSCVFVWSILDSKWESFFRKNMIEVIRVEDGFVHSVDRPSNSMTPFSWCFDKGGVYFDRNARTDIENVLGNYHFNVHDNKEGSRLLQSYLDSGVSKYNFQAPVDVEKVYGEKKRKRVLVIGQVEDDKSIQYGMVSPMTNNELVWLAKEENPEAEIIYKPHPDVLNGKRTSDSYSNPKNVESIAKVIYDDMSVKDSLTSIDHVYTMTSLVGFESVIRGIKTTVMGTPFYAGWGLTDDRGSIPKFRSRDLTASQLFLATMLMYPHYFYKKSLVSAEDIIDKVSVRKKLMQLEWEFREYG